MLYTALPTVLVLTWPAFREVKPTKGLSAMIQASRGIRLTKD